MSQDDQQQDSSPEVSRNVSRNSDHLELSPIFKGRFSLTPRLAGIEWNLQKFKALNQSYDSKSDVDTPSCDTELSDPITPSKHAMKTNYVNQCCKKLELDTKAPILTPCKCANCCITRGSEKPDPNVNTETNDLMDTEESSSSQFSQGSTESVCSTRFLTQKSGTDMNSSVTLCSTDSSELSLKLSSSDITSSVVMADSDSIIDSGPSINLQLSELTGIDTLSNESTPPNLPCLNTNYYVNLKQVEAELFRYDSIKVQSQVVTSTPITGDIDFNNGMSTIQDASEVTKATRFCVSEELSNSESLSCDSNKENIAPGSVSPDSICLTWSEPHTRHTHKTEFLSQPIPEKISLSDFMNTSF